jgi:L-threonylcarbamoyladenylate synthase
MVPPTRVLAIDRDKPDDAAIAEAARILLDGGLVAFATETVYGLGADATNPAAIARIFEAKGRPSTNPLIVHASDLTMARSCVAEWSELADELTQRFWPGPLTLVLPRSAIIPDLVTAGLETVGVRIPALRSTRSLIARVGRPLAAPSANLANRLSPTTAAHVLRDLEGRIDLILDDGPTSIGLESTVLDLTGHALRILRPGPITRRELQHALGGMHIVEATGESAGASAATSPGQFPVHYAPRTKMIRIEPDRLGDLETAGPSALLFFANFQPPPAPRFSTSASYRTPDEAAEGLYRLLHEWDGEGFSQIVVVLPPDLPEWRAVRDRLMRATVAEYRGGIS